MFRSRWLPNVFGARSKTIAMIATIKKFISGFMESGQTAVPDKTPDVPWLKYVAMLTGILAAISGFLAVRSTNLSNDAIYESNQAVLAQAQASDAWSEYQADSIKARILETQLVPSSPLNAADRKALAADDKEFRARQPQSKHWAETKTAERDAHLNNGLSHLAEKDLLGYAGLAMQLGIALASVAALIRKPAAFYAGATVGMIGIAITAYAFLSHITGL